MAPDTVKGSQLRQPLFEFSGACGGCGETQYLKLISQLFGDRLLVANATGCSSIYGGNLPTTPWTVNAEGRGPAWANSLFEDNAEFGLGIRLATDRLQARARQLVERLAPEVGRGPGPGHPGRRAGRRGRGRGPAGAGGRAAPAPGRGRLPGRAGAGGAGRRAGPAQPVDRRRGRLGLRHRLGRGGRRARLRPGRQPAGAGHRGLLQHRRPGVQGDPAGGGGQVRRPRQADPQEGPGHAGHGLRQRLCGPCGRRGQRHADRQGPAGGRGLAGPVAGHRLLDLHRPRVRHDRVDGPHARTP